MQRVSVDGFLEARGQRPLYDVRAPAEYAQGHIPGVASMPLFTDAERARVGTTYKQLGPENALLEGLDFAGPKLRRFVERVRREQDGSGVVALHCWRGGKRSESLAWLLEFAGMEVQVLEGGYKAYRRYVHAFFDALPFSCIVLGGYTGSGKTDLLAELAGLGEQVVDLEGLAHHRGSAFGGLGQGEQPSTEQFENDLFEALRGMDPSRPVWVENESRAVGRVFLPEGLWSRMQAAPLIHLDIPLEVRVQRLQREYCTYPPQAVKAALDRIRKRLGGQHHQRARRAIDEGDWERAVRIALRYYDKAYRHGSLNSRSETGTPFTFAFPKDDPAEAARALLRYARQHVYDQRSTPS